MYFKIALKVTKYLGYFCKNILSPTTIKLAQSGHTGRGENKRVKHSQPVTASRNARLWDFIDVGDLPVEGGGQGGPGVHVGGVSGDPSNRVPRVLAELLLEASVEVHLHGEARQGNFVHVIIKL